MERTQTHIVDASLAQRDELRYYIDNVGGIEYLLYCELVYHCIRLDVWSPKIQKRVQ